MGHIHCSARTKLIYSSEALGLVRIRGYKDECRRVPRCHPGHAEPLMYILFEMLSIQITLELSIWITCFSLILSGLSIRMRHNLLHIQITDIPSTHKQVVEPLRAMVLGAPLEDARHLAQRYDRMRQEAEAQAIGVSKRQMKVREAQAIGVSKRQMKVREAQAIGVSKRQMKVREAQDDTFIGVSKRQMKGREAPGNVDNNLKLEAVELKLQELMSNMTTLGKEAVSVMTAVEAQLQRLTLHKLIAMVESECTYHRRILQILDQLD